MNIKKLLLTMIIAIFSNDITWACDCWPVASSQEALKSSTLVFEGQVMQVQRFSIDRIKPDYKEFAVKLRKVKLWKGQSDNFYIIRTPAEKSDCGFEFKVGESYVVYATGTPVPQVTRCTRTAPSNSQGGKSDIIQLGIPKSE